MAKDPHDDTSKKNLKILRQHMVAGQVMKQGWVVPKAMYAKKTDWQNLENMEPPKVEQTDEAVLMSDDEKPAAKASGGKKAATKAKLP